MDIATILGFIIGPSLVLFGIFYGGGTLKMFTDVPSILIVGGGSVASMLIAFPLREVFNFHRVFKVGLFAKARDPKALIKELVQYAEIARRDGILSLENSVRDIKDPFLVTGIQMAVDGTDPELIQQIMENELDAIDARHGNGKALLENIGKYAPAFGMIGTLIGLVQMLANMSDPSSIGAGMAVALLTTLYGSVVSNMMALPVSEKLTKRHNEEMLIKNIVLQGVMAIQSGDNPRVVEQKLKTVLPVAQRQTAAEAA